MHFFLNKIGYLPEYGFIVAPDYNRLPFQLALQADQRASDDTDRFMFAGRHRWLPNMGATQRQVAVLPDIKRT